jgi:ATP-binding cassette subfamily F protein 3
VRQTLGAYLFGGKAASRRVCDLSGGEKARLVLAELLYSRPNLLILDEPTNHMDIRARETIESALSTYRGTLLFVSHDRYFIRQAADAILVFEGDQVMYYPFGYEHYLERKKQKGEDLSALIRAEDQALISGLRAVPKAERHRLREMDTEDAYFDWQLRLAGEQMEEARMKVELLWEKYCEQEINAWQDDSWILLEERKKQLDEAWENWTQACLSWMEIWESMGENSPENI